MKVVKAIFVASEPCGSASRHRDRRQHSCRRAFSTAGSAGVNVQRLPPLKQLTPVTCVTGAVLVDLVINARM
jgi:hypothetical protein